MPDLHLSGGVAYSLEEATAVVVGYCCGTEPITFGKKMPRVDVDLPSHRPAFAYAFYDAVPRHESEGRATVLDVLVANGPNARMTGYHYAQLTGALPAINEALGKIPISASLVAVSRSGLAQPDAGDGVTFAMWEAWSAAYKLDGINVARVNKLLHRVRPSLFPLYDNETAPYLGTDAWLAVRDDLDANRGVFEELERAVRGSAGFNSKMPMPTALRVHDILLWCEARGQRAYASELAR